MPVDEAGKECMSEWMRMGRQESDDEDEYLYDSFTYQKTWTYIEMAHVVMSTSGE